VSLNKRSYIAGLSFDYPTSGAFAVQALRLGEKVAPGDVGTTIAQINACDSLGHSGDAARALPYCDAGIAGMLKGFGADSDYTAEAHDSKGATLLALERFPDAVAEYMEVVRVFEKIGAANPTVVGALGGIGRAQLAMGQPRRAAATLERALAMTETVELNTQVDKVIGAEVRFALARALASSGGAPARIDKLASESAEMYQRLGLEPSAREVADWSSMRARGLLPGHR
jgi:hypothetical protein